MSVSDGSVTLYEITGKIKDIERLYAQLDTGDISEEGLEEALALAMEESTEDLETKITGMIRLLKTWEVTEKAIKSEADRLAKRHRSFANKQKHLKGYMRDELEKVDAKTLRLEIATVSRPKGREFVTIIDEMALPQGYFEVQSAIVADKKALLELWHITPEDERESLPGFKVERNPQGISIR